MRPWALPPSCPVTGKVRGSAQLGSRPGGPPSKSKQKAGARRETRSRQKGAGGTDESQDPSHKHRAREPAHKEHGSSWSIQTPLRCSLSTAGRGFPTSPFPTSSSNPPIRQTGRPRASMGWGWGVTYPRSPAAGLSVLPAQAGALPPCPAERRPSQPTGFPPCMAALHRSRGAGLALGRGRQRPRSVSKGKGAAQPSGGWPQAGPRGGLRM